MLTLANMRALFLKNRTQSTRFHASCVQLEWYKQKRFADNANARPKGIIVVNAESTLEAGIFRKKARLVKRRQVICLTMLITDSDAIYPPQNTHRWHCCYRVLI